MEDMVIKICMGSSCFSRGNKENLEVIRDYLNNHSKSAKIYLTGNLCQGMCNKGPNLFINDKAYHRVDSTQITEILDKVLN